MSKIFSLDSSDYVHYILLCIVHYNEMLFYTHFLLQK